MIRLLLLTCACAVLVACAPARPLTDSEVYSFCLMDDSFSVEDSCDSEMGICDAYRGVVSTPYPGLGPCLSACREAYQELIRVRYTGNCFGRINKGHNICVQYCRRQYPKP